MSENRDALRRNISAAKPSILVVDDEVLLRLMLSEQLREHGYDVVEAADADDALLKIGTLLPHLIITDVRMPGSMDGLGLLNKVRKNHVSLPVIIVSAHHAFLGNIDGNTVFFSKPYSFDEIARKVDMLLQTDVT